MCQAVLWSAVPGVAGLGLLLLALKMSQNSIDDILILNATVRRSDDDIGRTNSVTANLKRHE
jgi:hypothetical protein